MLRSRVLQRFVVGTHERAFRRILPALGEVRSVLVVGGGLFPRTAMVLRRVLPTASLTVVDANASHLESARRFLDDTIVLRHAFYSGAESAAADLVVVPLAYMGNRRRIYERPPARVVLVHDWIWARHGQGVIVSIFLLKRLNLVVPASCEMPRSVLKSA